MFKITEFKRIHKIVKKAIDKWDPYALLASGAPKDEFDSETNMVLTKINIDSNVEEIANVISEVFSEMFFPEDFPVEDCIDVAKSIYENLLSLHS